MISIVVPNASVLVFQLAYSETLGIPFCSETLLGGYKMSLEQIRRQFRFVNDLLFGEEEWPDAKTDARISVISQEALYLPVDYEHDGDLRYERDIYLKDELGESIFPNDVLPIDILPEETTLGHVLRRVFKNCAKEYAEDLAYVVYVSKLNVAKFRASKLQRLEIVIFKVKNSEKFLKMLKHFHRSNCAHR